MRHINFRSIISMIVIFCSVIYMTFNYQNLTKDFIVIFGIVLAWMIINIFPFGDKYDGELQVFDDNDKKTYRFVVYDDPENLGEKEDLRFHVINRK